MSVTSSQRQQFATMPGWEIVERGLADLAAGRESVKEELGLNVELASPLDFLPELPGWRERSPFVAQAGQLTVRHFDPYSQALAKLDRGFAQDQRDVAEMIERRLVDPTRLAELLAQIEGQLFRFPAVDATALRESVNGLDGSD